MPSTGRWGTTSYLYIEMSSNKGCVYHTIGYEMTIMDCCGDTQWVTRSDGGWGWSDTSADQIGCDIDFAGGLAAPFLRAGGE